MIVKAYHDLTAAINGIKNNKSDAHLEALNRIQANLTPGNQMPIEVSGSRRPRVERPTEQREELTYSQSPRVHFQEQLIEPSPTRMIVASPKEAIVASSPSPQPTIHPKSKSILKQPKFTASDSIAERVKSRHASHNDNQTTNAPE